MIFWLSFLIARDGLNFENLYHQCFEWGIRPRETHFPFDSRIFQKWLPWSATLIVLVWSRTVFSGRKVASGRSD
jgi:hypothetical protein